MLTREKISGSPNNLGRSYFNCPVFPNRRDFFIWRDDDENYVDPVVLIDLYGQLQEQGQIIMKNNVKLHELKSKQLYKKTLTSGFITTTVVWVMLIVLSMCLFLNSLNAF